MEENRIEEVKEEVEEKVEEAVETVEEKAAKLEEEIRKELEEVKEEASQASDEAKEEIGNVADKILAALKNFKDTVAGMEMSEGVTVGNYVENLSKTITEVVGNAAEKFNELKDDPKTAEALGRAREKLEGIGTVVAGKVKDVWSGLNAEEKPEETEEKPEEDCGCEETVEEVEEIIAEITEEAEEDGGLNTEVKKVVDTVTEKAKVATEYVADKYQEFVHDENVRKTVRDAKTFVADFAGKVVTGVKSLYEKREDVPAEEKNDKEE